MTQDVFAPTIQKTNELLRDIEEEFGWQERRNQSYAALRCALHTLRDRLTAVEAAQFGAQLPMLVRGMFFEGWKPTARPIKMSREEFLNKVQQEFQFFIDRPIADLVRVVMLVVHKHVSSGELGDIRSSLPKEFSDLLPE